MEQVRKFNEPNIVCFRRKQYDVQPQERYCGDRFPLLVGTDRYPTRILPDNPVRGRDYPEDGTVELVPVEYKTEFQKDPEGSLRDVLGIATDAITPWIAQRHKIVDAILRGRERGLRPIVDCADVDFALHGLPQIVEGNLPPIEERQEFWRWVHIDLAPSQDRAGLAMVKHTGWVQHVAESGAIEHLPTFAAELSLAIKPSTTERLNIADLRSWVMQLATFWGFRLYAVTFDGFQSADSIQILRRAGLRSYVVSVDRTIDPYEYLRRGFYQDRIDLVEHDTARLELASLEFNQQKGKVDHPPRGSKDVADAITGATFAAARSRLLRTGPEYRDQGGGAVRVRGLNGNDPSRLRRLGQPPRRTDAWGNPLQE